MSVQNPRIQKQRKKFSYRKMKVKRECHKVLKNESQWSVISNGMYYPVTKIIQLLSFSSKTFD